MIVIDCEDERVATHEAGHLMLMWPSDAVRAVLGTRLLKTRARIDIEHADPFLLRHALDGLAMTAAGMAAESLIFGDFEPGPCSSDLKLLQETIVGIQAAMGGMLPAPPWPETSRSEAPPFERLFKTPLEIGHGRLMVSAYRRAMSLLVADLRRFHRLRELFIERFTRSHDEIAAVLGPRPTFA